MNGKCVQRKHGDLVIEVANTMYEELRPASRKIANTNDPRGMGTSDRKRCQTYPGLYHIRQPASGTINFD